MSSNYIITEPAPSTTTYIRSGRGGAGNTHRITSSSNKTSSSSRSNTNASAPTTTRTIIPAALASRPRPSPARFFSGIGGAGNVHQPGERPTTVSLDEEFQRRAASRENAASVGHCGIGGAGNVFRRKESDASVESVKTLQSDTDSVRSSMSDKAKLWARVSGTFARD